MVFSSGVFLFLFLPFVIIGYYNPIIRSRNYRNTFLYIASLLFYAYGEPLYVFLMFLSTAVTWLLGLLYGRSKRKRIIVIGTVYHIVMLFVFKYLSFIASQIGIVFGSTSSVNIALPIGISFMTFQMMSYLFDLYYGRVSVQRSFLKVGLYISMFPQLIAGPIVRYGSIARQIDNRTESIKNIEDGLVRFSIGLCKKVLIADVLATFSDRIVDSCQNAGIGAATAWIGSIAFTLQIYYDFSGYSDMAIGLGKCFGFHFDENFNYPYIADSITDFWRRWHISLTDWFRDYVYIPLGGNRKGRSIQVRNTVVVWVLTGIWHGANWTFLLWGGVYCVIQLAERYLLPIEKLPMVIRRIYTLLIVNFCWVLFKADSIGAAINYIRVMLGKNGLIDINTKAYILDSVIMVVLGCIFATPIVKVINGRLNNKRRKVIEAFVYFVMAVAFAVAVMMIISGGYSPFIYFNF